MGRSANPRGTNMPAIGSFNQNVILDRIRHAPEGISKAELAGITGLSGQTIANASRRLIDDGLVEEAGTLIQGRGKPPVMLRLRPSGRYAVGVHLDPAVVTYVILDLAGRVVAHDRTRTPHSGDPAALVADIARGVEAIIEAAGIDRAALFGIGIAAPGPIDAELGTVVDPPLLDGWRDVPLRDAVSAATGQTVLLEKDVNAASVAEIWMGAEGRRDFAFFYLGTGIGIGLALDRMVLRGATGNAGEGGTIVVPAAGLPKHRRSEMLGHLATPEYLVEQAREEGLLEATSGVDDQLAALITLAGQGDATAVAIFERAGRVIGEALVTLVNLLDLDEIVFGGPYWSQVAALVLPSVASTLANSPERRTHYQVRLSESTVGDDVAAFGAACLVLESSFATHPSALLIAE